ncbi:hypothetical protein GCM10009081_19390 [Brevundimonas nasdae]
MPLLVYTFHPWPNFEASALRTGDHGELSAPMPLTAIDPKRTVWLPIAPDVAVGPGKRDQWEQGFTLEEAKPIRDLNEATWGQSSMVVGRSPDLIRSLASRR